MTKDEFVEHYRKRNTRRRRMVSASEVALLIAGCLIAMVFLMVSWGAPVIVRGPPCRGRLPELKRRGPALAHRPCLVPAKENQQLIRLLGTQRQGQHARPSPAKEMIHVYPRISPHRH